MMSYHETLSFTPCSKQTSRSTPYLRFDETYFAHSITDESRKRSWTLKHLFIRTILITRFCSAG
ncbi:hypothetical protein PO124_05525 [Bacillus licheniformis]|nr:hypothetical protein [Bacillus licheniformis]